MAHVFMPRCFDPYNLPEKGTALNDCSWYQISNISRLGLAKQYFSVGDTKSILMNGSVPDVTFSNLSIDVFIAGFDHNSELEGENTIHFQIGQINGVNVAFDNGSSTENISSGTLAFNMHKDNVLGRNRWDTCSCRTTLLGSDRSPLEPIQNSFMSCLPADLRAVMRSVTKYTDNAGRTDESDSTNVTATTDFLWLPSLFEVGGSDLSSGTSASAESEYQAQYEYYQASSDSNKVKKQVKYKHNDPTTARNYWTRTPDSDKNFTTVSPVFSGSQVSRVMAGFKYQWYVGRIAPMFCV